MRKQIFRFRKPHNSSPAEYLLLKDDPALGVKRVFERSVANFGSLYIQREWCKRETVFRTWNEHERLGNVSVCARACTDFDNYFNKIQASKRTHHVFKDQSLQRSNDWKHCKKYANLDSLRGSCYILFGTTSRLLLWSVFRRCWHSAWDKEKLWSEFGNFGCLEKAIMFQRSELPSDR